MGELTLNDYATDFVMCARSVSSIADEVADLVGRDRLDDAILVLGVSHGKLAELADSMAEMQKQLGSAGANWKRPLGRADEE